MDCWDEIVLCKGSINISLEDFENEEVFSNAADGYSLPVICRLRFLFATVKAAASNSGAVLIYSGDGESFDLERSENFHKNIV